MEILIFGGTRFMGRHLSQVLLAAGYDVTMANRGTRSPVSGVRHITCDRNDPSALDALIDVPFDHIVDFSAYDSRWVEQAGAAFKNKIKRYIFISSGAVYKRSEHFPVQEHFPLGAEGAHREYSEQKIRSEGLLVDFSRNHFFETVSCRLPYVLGSENYEDRESFVLSRLLADRPIVVPEHGNAMHSFVYAGDVATAIHKLMIAGAHVDGQAFNIAYPETTTSMGFILTCAQVCGKTPRLYPLNLEASGLASEKFDLKDLLFPFPQINGQLDTTKLAKYVGFTPSYALFDMIKEFYNWWIKRGGATPREYERENQALKLLGL